MIDTTHNTDLKKITTDLFGRSRSIEAVMDIGLEPTCAVCRSAASIKKCARCRNIHYCSPTCQRANWRSHRATCHPPQVWHDTQRRCNDGANHEGRLELITWPTPAAATISEEDMGWGNCILEESEDLKKEFEIEYEGDEEKFYEYWPQGFRWTCCGVLGDQKFGCDHHGTGTKPCTCDFCHVSPSRSWRFRSQILGNRHG